MFAVIVTNTGLQLLVLCPLTLLFALCFYFSSGFRSLFWGSLSQAIFVFLITIPDTSSPENNEVALAHPDFLCLKIQCELFSMELPCLLVVESDSVDPHPDIRGMQFPTSGGRQVTWLLLVTRFMETFQCCLLYTSDAADE